MLLKLEKWVFYLFIFCLPFQTRIILKSWGESFNEWNSAFLYGTDILLAALFIFWLIRTTVQGRRGAVFVLDTKTKTSTPTSPSRFLLFFLIICTLSLFVADNLALGFYRLIKILEFVGLYYYIQFSLKPLGGETAKWRGSLRGSFLMVAVSGFFQAIIAIGQSLLQHSLGLKWLGESILRTNFNAVAVVPVEGEKFLRAYGTLPHPNLLAVFLFFSIFLASLFYFNHKNKAVWFWLIYPVSLFALFSTFSRTVIGISFLAFLIYLFRERKNVLKIKKVLLVAGLVSILFVFLFTPQVLSRLQISGEEQAVSDRFFYNSVGKGLIENKPWLGIGLGNFVNWFQTSQPDLSSWTYQPIHNLYLLIASETGLFGLSAFLVFLFLIFKNNHRSSLTSLFLAFLAIGLLDHFFWTLQQGQLIFWITLGLMSISGSFKSMQ